MDPEPTVLGDHGCPGNGDRDCGARAIGKAHLELYRAKAEFEILSCTDELTGLLNRRALMQMAAAQPPETMVLVIADIDRFKRVNDCHGHMAGDAVIQMVSRVAQAELGDLGCRAALAVRSLRFWHPISRRHFWYCASRTSARASP